MIDTTGLPFGKKIREKKSRKGLRSLGKVGRARLDVVAELDAQYSDEPFYHTCEIATLLRERGLLLPSQFRCLGSITWAHARKTHQRHDNATLGSPESHYTACRACSFHHMNCLDLLKPKTTEAVVMSAIAARCANG